MTARTSDEILVSFQESVSKSDETADTKKGPLYDLVGKPLADTLAPTETKVDELEQIYSAQFSSTATDTQAAAFVQNWGETPGLGNPSQVRVYFMKFSRPSVTASIPVPVGAIVGSIDQNYQYVTVESGQIVGNIADTYYNPTRKAFEISLLCKAVANGSEYDLPPGRINTVISQVDGIDAVENREQATGGEQAETPQDQVLRAQKKFEGTAINTPGGAASRIQAYSPSVIKDVRTVVSTNRNLFRRITFIPGADHYLLASSIKTISETYVSQTGGETLLPLSNVPAISVNSATLNGVSLTGCLLVKDTSLVSGFSSGAKDQLLLPSPLLAGDVVVYNISYNSIIQDVQRDVLTQTQLFQTSELAREFFPIPVRIEMTGKTLSSFDPVEVSLQIQTELQKLIEPGLWQEMFFPDIVLQTIKSKVSGISSLTTTMFQRVTGALSDIETVVMKDNELAKYDSQYVSIQLRSI
jgi:hypothetical protein